ncbi:MAG TPA: sigma 54-interacting transcriptional regulator [Thermoanaerobaculia bacterium]|jgi:transcriptional regulator with GAF, ATPase, and Fis domain|nr:sigma 54-interacting transcriptional regulator [Thermoanaerobaculia bacterium]
MATPSLVALTGPLRGRSFELATDPSGGQLALGRHPSNSVRIPELSVSRHHCTLRHTPEGWRVTDLDSRLGTFVNGRPVHEALLRHGDLLAVGESSFLVSLDDEPAREIPVLSDAAVLETGTEIRLPAGESIYLRADRITGAARGDRAARSLGALLEIAAACGTLRDPEALAGRLLELILAAVPAERGAVLFPAAESQEGEEDGFSAVYRQARLNAREGAPFPVSRTVARRVLGERTALLWNGPQGVPPPAESVTGAGVSAFLAVPLIHQDRAFGLIYADTRADTRGPETAFEEEHLQLLAAAAVLVAGSLATALRYRDLEQENRRLQSAEIGPGLVGESAGLRRVVELIGKVAPTPATVLILGESGTGKELAARALHAASRRSGHPFVAINCATLSETLLESELFGHEKGAFTGAVARKSGKLEVARGGTLFLDEVGEMPLSLQAKLLRVLQERTFERVGGTQPLTADIRLVAATNRDLPQAIAAGTFRSDLYYRLNVIALTLPPLRERREDIALLAAHFAALHGRAVRGRPVGISPAARTLLLRYEWPGNIRELSNAIERAVVLGQDDVIQPDDLPETLLETGPSASAAAAPSFHEAVNRCKRELILEAVAASGGTITRAAERLGLHPNHLHRLITSLDLRTEIE